MYVNFWSMVTNIPWKHHDLMEYFWALGSRYYNDGGTNPSVCRWQLHECCKICEPCYGSNKGGVKVPPFQEHPLPYMHHSCHELKCGLPTSVTVCPRSGDHITAFRLNLYNMAIRKLHDKITNPNTEFDGSTKWVRWSMKFIPSWVATWWTRNWRDFYFLVSSQRGINVSVKS